MQDFPDLLETVRLTVLPTAEVPKLLNLPGPTLPTSQTNALGPELVAHEAAFARDPQVLQSVANILYQTDVSQLHFQRNPAPVVSPLAILDGQLHSLYPQALSCPIGHHVVNHSAPQPTATPFNHHSSARNPSLLEVSVHANKHLSAGVNAGPDAEDSEDVPLHKAKRARTIAFSAQEMPPPQPPELQANAILLSLRRFVASARQPADANTEGAQYFSMRDLRSVTEEITKARAAGLLSTIHSSKLKEVLAILHEQTKAGLNVLIDEDADERSVCFQAVHLSVEAAITSMFILTASGMPSQVFVDEHLEALINTIKFHLQYNVMVFYDVVMRAKYRPSMEQGNSTGRGQKAGSRSSKLMARRCIQQLTGRMVLAIDLVAELLVVVRVEAEKVLPFVRTALQCLTVEGLTQVQRSAAGLVVRVFTLYQEHRSSVWEEFVTAMHSYIQAGRYLPFYYGAEDQQQHMQNVTFIALQLIQAAAELPAVDAEASEVINCIESAKKYARLLCSFFFDRLLPEAKVQKSDTAVDYKHFVEVFIGDLLRAQHLPEWPAATVILSRVFLWLLGVLKPSMLGGAEAKSDKNMHLMCIDFLGLIATHLCADTAQKEREDQWVKEVLAVVDTEQQNSIRGMSDVEKLQQLLVRHLAGQPSNVAALARQCLACQGLSIHLQGQQRTSTDQAAQAAAKDMLLHYRLLQDGQVQPIIHEGQPLVLDTAQAAKVARALVHRGSVGSMKVHMLAVLAQTGDRSRQDVDAAKVRAKAIKGLGSAVDADMRMLGIEVVQKGVEAALRDDSVSVREAAVDLIGKYISRSRDLALKYFDIVCRASQDPGITVRKRAVKILWECCVRSADFPRATDAIIQIMKRASDNELTMRGLVVRICNDLWFTPGVAIDSVTEGIMGQRSASSRAKQLAEVAYKVYCDSGDGIGLPLPSSHSLVVLVKEAMGEEGKGGHEARAGGKQVADELLEQIVQRQSSGADAGNGSAEEQALQELNGRLAGLLAIHAICEAQPGICISEQDPPKYIRVLMPYLPKDVPSGAGSKEIQKLLQKRTAEVLLCLLSILYRLVDQVPELASDMMKQLRSDLCGIIQHHPYVLVVAAGVRCLCALARLHKESGGVVVTMAKRSYKLLHDRTVQQKDSKQATSEARSTPRFMFITGLLCRYGAAILDSAAADGKGASLQRETITCRQCLELLVKAFQGREEYSRELSSRIADAALQAIGLVLVARPDLMEQVDGCLDIYLEVMQPEATVDLKSRVLSNLVELLKEENDSLLQRQQASGEEQQGQQQATQDGGQGSKVLAQVNGEGDGISVTFGVIQAVWSRMLSLACDISFRPARGPTPPQDDGQVVRRKALDLIEAVMTGGHMPPWTSVKTLVCLATDPQPDVSGRALKVLKTGVEKFNQLVKNELGPGVEGAFAFQKALWDAKQRITGASSSTGSNSASFMDTGESASALQGVSAVYSTVIQPDKGLRSVFLSFLVSCFNKASCIASTGASKDCDVQELSFLCHALASLPYRRADEPLQVLHYINSAITTRTVDVERALSASLVKGEDGEDGQSEEVLAPESVQLTPALAAQLRACLALSMVLVLKQYLKAVYGISASRVVDFDSNRKQEEMRNVSKDTRQVFKLEALALNAASCPEAAVKQFKIFRRLLEQDTADYRESGMIAEYEALDDEQKGAHVGDSSGVEGLLLYHEAKTTKKGGRGGRGGGGSARKPRGGAAQHTPGTATKGRGGGKKRKSRFGPATGEEEEEEGDGAVYTP